MPFVKHTNRIYNWKISSENVYIVSRAYTIDRMWHMSFEREYRIISAVACLSWHLDCSIEFVSRNCSATIKIGSLSRRAREATVIHRMLKVV